MTLAHLGAEACRLHLLRGLEGDLALCGMTRVAGVDEVGRGSLAGPVVAAAVVPTDESVIPGVDDSKRLDAAQRRRIARRVRETAVAWSVAPVSPSEIDRMNILEATREAMTRAVLALDPAPDAVLVDAVRLPRRRRGGFPPSFALVRGDGISYAIACASILAKDERDRMMRELDRSFPQYGFAQHKGYGAARHLAALREFGPCPHHRLTFRSVLPSVEVAAR